MPPLMDRFLVSAGKGGKTARSDGATKTFATASTSCRPSCPRECSPIQAHVPTQTVHVTYGVFNSMTTRPSIPAKTQPLPVPTQRRVPNAEFPRLNTTPAV